MTKFTDKEFAKAIARLADATGENPVAFDTGTQAKTEARKKLDQAVQESLTRLFDAHWIRNELPTMQREYKFHPNRRWRFDYALPGLLIAVEVDGGTRQQGRHNRAAGYAKDAEKINAALGMGWRVWRFSDVMIHEGRDAMDEYLDTIRTAIEEATE